LFLKIKQLSLTRKDNVFILVSLYNLSFSYVIYIFFVEKQSKSKKEKFPLDNIFPFQAFPDFDYATPKI